MELMEHQLEVIPKLSSGKILYGGTGTGKGATVLGYYMQYEAPRHIYIITTARKRDDLDWETEAAAFGISTEDHLTNSGIITVDSWNNLKHYEDIEDAFFVFDEQRLVGHGAWVKSFLKLAKKNHWLLLSGTPGDNWMDYAPVFIANGYYKNITEFKIRHVVYEPYVKFPKVKHYLNETKLELLRNEVLVEMPYLRHTERMLNWIDVGYNVEMFRRAFKNRWHVYEDRPIKDVAELYRVMRKIVNTDPSRFDTLLELTNIHPRLIVFYNYNYELEILRKLSDHHIPVYEYNGHQKDNLPTGERWIYLVQYVAGAEAWNCTTTDAMVLYSMTYSYKNFEQAQGRIDRLDTKFETLYYYIFVSNSVIDRGIKAALERKENFNERKFVKEVFEFDEF